MMNKNSENTSKILTRKNVMKAWGYFQIFAENVHSFERMQAIGVATSFADCLRKIYKDDDEKFKRSLKRHLQLFNSNANIGGSVLGMALSMEEQMKDMPEEEKDEAINSIKTSLMGPLAGIGDSIDWGMLKPIFLGIAVSFGVQGNPIGLFICFAFCVLILLEGRFCWWLGYSKGADVVARLLSSTLFKKVISAAQLLGMLMMGALSASYVYLSTPLMIPTGDSALSLQEAFDSIVPGLLPLASVLLIYYLMKKKTQNFGLLSLAIIVICVIGSIIGIL